MGSISSRKHGLVFWKSWIWEQYLSNMHLWNLNFETLLNLKICNFEIFKRWSLGTLDFDFQWEEPHPPTTFRLPPLHQPPSWGTRVILGDTSGWDNMLTIAEQSLNWLINFWGGGHRPNCIGAIRGFTSHCPKHRTSNSWDSWGLKTLIGEKRNNRVGFYSAKRKRLFLW